MIDLADIGNRILSLPIPSRNYVELAVGKSGVLFLAEGPPVGRSAEDEGSPIRALWRFTTEKRQTEEMLSGLTRFKVSFNGEKLFYATARQLVSRADRRVEARFARRQPGQAREQPRHDRHARSARLLEADVSRNLAPAARFSLRSASHGLDIAQDRSEIPAVSRGLGLAR